MAGHERSPGYTPGEYWVTCDRCGFDYKNTETRLTWDGLLVCLEDWEPRNEQEFLRPIADITTPAGEVRPPPPDSFEVVNTQPIVPGVPDGTFNN